MTTGRDAYKKIHAHYIFYQNMLVYCMEQWSEQVLLTSEFSSAYIDKKLMQYSAILQTYLQYYPSEQEIPLTAPSGVSVDAEAIILANSLICEKILSIFSLNAFVKNFPRNTVNTIRSEPLCTPIFLVVLLADELIHCAKRKLGYRNS